MIDAGTVWRPTREVLIDRWHAVAWSVAEVDEVVQLSQRLVMVPGVELVAEQGPGFEGVVLLAGHQRPCVTTLRG